MGGGNKYLTANNKQRTAFVHNPGSKKTAHILSLPNEGLCYTCHETIEWKKRYRKYKPLTVPGKCAHCHQKTVRRAYHLTCDDCTLKLQVCGKCQKPKDIIKEIITKEVEIKEQAEIRDALKDMTERERRTFYRDLEKGEEKKDKKEKKNESGDDDSDNNDDDQEENDEDDDDDDDEDDSEDYEDEDDDEDYDNDEPSAPKTRAQLTVKSVTQDMKKLTTVFTNDQVGQLMKNSKKSSTTTTASTPTKKPSTAMNEEDEDEDEEEDDVQVLSAEKMYLKLKEQYKSKSKTEKQSNNLINNEENDVEDDDEDAIYDEENDEEEDDEEDEDN